MADEKLVIDVIARDRASRDFDRVGDAAVRTGKDFDKAAAGAGRLQSEIDQTTINLRELGREFDKTGDKALLRDIGKERRTLSGLVRLRKEMAGLADDTGKLGAQIGISTGKGLFASLSLTKVLSAAGPALGAAGGPIVAGLATLIGAGVAGAIGGGAGAAAIAAGVSSAARDPKVQNAFDLLAGEASTAFADFGEPFVEPTVKAIGNLRGVLADVRDDLDDIGRVAATFLEPLAGGAGGFISEVVAGFRSLTAHAGPVFEMLGDELPVLGRAVRIFFEDMGDGAQGGADALRTMLQIISTSIVATGKVLNFLADAYDKAEDLSTLLHDQPQFIARQLDSQKKWIKSAKDMSRAADDVKWSVKGMSDAFSHWLGLALDAEEHADRFREMLLGVNEAVAENGRSLGDNTEGGLRNQQMLRDMVRELDAARQAEISKATATEQSIARANAAYDEGIKKIIEAGVKAGLSRKELEKLVGPYGIRVYMTGLEQIRQQLRALAAAASVVPGLGGASIAFGLASGIIGAALAQRFGGIVKAAQGAVVNSPTVLFGERGTGTEVFVPQLGISRQRGLALSSVAAGMHGGTVVPNEQLAGVQEHRIVIEGTGLLSGLRREIRIRGGNAQTVLGR